MAESRGYYAADDVAPVRYEDFGFKPLDETAEPLDPDARAMQDYVQEADRGNYTCSPSNSAPATVQLFVTKRSEFSPKIHFKGNTTLAVE